MTESTKEKKRELRKSIRKVLAETTVEKWEEISSELSFLCSEWLQENPEIQRVALYAALPTEINLTLLTRLLPSIEWHFPVVSGTSLTFHRVTDLETLEAGYQGVQEPNPQIHPPIIAETLDLIICPGLGFTPQGDRIGRGGGFYDRFLETVPNARKLGVCSPQQLMPTLPHDELDHKMSHLLTLNGVEKVSPHNEPLPSDEPLA